MKLLFCHDGPMSMDTEGNAYPQNFTEEVLARYFTIADNMSFLVRTRLVDPNKTNAKRINNDSLKIVSIPNLSTASGVITNRSKMRDAIRKEMVDSDLLIARLPSQVGFMAIDIANKMKKPYLVEVVACPWDAFWNHSLKGKLVAPFMYYSTKKYVKNAEYVLYVTNEFLQKRYPTKGKSIGCSDVALKKLDLNILENRLEKIARKSINDPIIIGTTAAMNVRYKGQEYVIKAISKLIDEGFNFEYYLVGGGDTEYLRSIAKKYNVTDRIKFLGLLPHDEVFEYLDNIDIYVQPSRQEGLPRALVEAMSRGCPSMGSTTGGIPELLDKEFIFQNGSIKEICKLLRKMDKQNMLEQAKRSFNKAKEYDKDLLNDKRLSFYKQFKEESIK